MSDDTKSKTPPPPEQERREAAPVPDEALYQLSRGEVSDFITKERRKDELDRVREVQVQKRVWKNTMGVCTAAVVALLGLALWGLFK